MTFDGMELLCNDTNTEEVIVYKKRKIGFFRKLFEEIKLKIWVKQFIKKEYGNPYKYPELFEE